MGCDIHWHVEFKRDDGSWEFVQPILHPNKERPRWFYDNRNYRTFAMLADVRNDWDIEPIAKPRGWPDDISEEVRDADWGPDFHTRTWLTLRELDSPPGYKLKVVHNRVMIPIDDLELFRRTGRPPTYTCSWASPADKYAWVEYDMTYREAAWWLFEVTVPAMRLLLSEKLKRWPKPEDEDRLRAVFAFDN